MECSTPGITEAADSGGAGQYSSEEQEGREPDGVHFDRERARRLLEAVSGAQPAGREEGESGGGDSGWTEAGRPAACPWPGAGQPLHDIPDLETRYLRNFRIHMRAVSTKFQVLSSWRSTGLAQPHPSRAIYHSYLSLILYLHIASLPFQSPTVMTDLNGFIQFTLFLFIYLATPLKLVARLLPYERSELWKVFLNPSLLLSLTTVSWLAIFLS